VTRAQAISPRLARHAGFQRRATAATLAILVSSFLFGGQSVEPTFVQSIPQTVAIVALALVFYRTPPKPLAAGAAPMLLLAGAALALIVFQLLPLPFDLWTAPPGREIAVATVKATQIGARWHPLSEDYGATLQSALMLLPAFAMLLIGLTLDREGLRWIVIAILSCATLSLLLGWLQVMAGVDSPLYFYGGQRERLSVGLFSNRNHQADALCIGTLMAGSTIYFFAPRVAALRKRAGLIAIAVAALFGIGVVATGSRTGAILFVPAAILTIAVALVDSRGRDMTRRSLAIVGVIAVVVAVLGWAGLDQLLTRFGASKDLRYTIWPDAWYLAKLVWPLGSGFGTFELAYQQVESLSGVTPLLINAAHSDYLQLLIEGGAPALALILAFLGWVAVQVRRLAKAGEGMTGWFAAAGIALLLLHSAVDYPLRTEALSVVMMALCVILNMAAHPSPAPEPVAPSPWNPAAISTA
jgi:O-antigen ligase